MKKNFIELSIEEINVYLNGIGYNNNKPLLLSFDGDKTIVDRERGSHFLSDSVMDMFNLLEKNTQFIITMNTGRDFSNYSPLQLKTGHSDPNIFLAGRVMFNKGVIQADQRAVFSKKLKRNLWIQFVNGDIPFLDVKYDKGNIFFVSSRRGYEKYYGHHRPVDWFEHLIIEKIDIDMDVDVEEIFMMLPIVRIEIPFIKKSENEPIINAINSKNKKQVAEIVESRIGNNDDYELMYIPAPTNHSHNLNLVQEVASVRIVVHDKYVNKGIGLKKLIDTLDIPEANVFYFGDSADDKANDAIVKNILPTATLIITDNGDEKAKRFADFVVDDVSNDGVPKAVNKLIEFQKRYCRFQ